MNPTMSPESPAESPLDVHATLEGKRLVLLGATGFLGKVWLSLLLYQYRNIGHIYMMVRPKKGLTPNERFWTEVAPSPVFDPIRKELGAEGCDALFRKVITPIGGDIVEPYLGLNETERGALRGNTDVIVNVSGIVDFNPPLDEALKVNAFGSQNLIQLARDLGDLPVLHTSTCYVVGNRSGVTVERNPLEFPFPRAEELDLQHWDADREISECTDLVKQAQRRVEDAPRQSHLLDQAKSRLKARHEPLRGSALEKELEKVKRDFVRKRLIAAGKERANFWGWPNIYTYTKSIGEQVLMRSGLDVTIVRPSIVESSVAYPQSGWCEGISTSTPLAYLMFKGHMSIPVADHCHYDAIPVDMCSAGMIAALAALLQRQHKPVYQLCSSDINPLKTKRVAGLVGMGKRLHYKQKSGGNPLVNELQARLEPRPVTKGAFARRSAPAAHKATKMLDTLLSKAEHTAIEDMAAPMRTSLAKTSRRLFNISRVFEEFMPFIAGHDLRFSAKETRALMASLSSEDAQRLYWAPEHIDWRHFWMDVHIPGMQRWSFPLLEEKLKTQVKAFKPHDTLSDMLEDIAERHPDSVALQALSGDALTRITYGQLLHGADHVAASLARHGVSHGDRVALAGRNHPNWGIAYFGIIRAGATAVPIDKEHEAEAVATVLEASKSRLLLIDEDLLPEAALPCPRLDLHELVDAALGQVEPPPTPDPRLSPDDIASILYTSGTTGSPKGVMLAHRNFTALIAALAAVFPLEHRDRLLSVLPLHHTFEFSCGLLLPLSRGARVVYLDKVQGDRIQKGLELGKITTMAGVPAVWELIERRILNNVNERGALAKYAFDSLMSFNRSVSTNFGLNLGRLLFAPVHQEMGGHLRTLISGAASLPPEVHKTFQGLGLPLAEGYGLTEAAPVLTVAKPSNRSKGGHVGRSLPGVEIKIQNPDADGIGEVLAKGPNVMTGYAENPEATDQALQDGWLHTGDLGQLDRKGRLKIMGRSKDVIVATSGENVYPDDVEQRLGKVEGIQELCVVGLSDPKVGELVACMAVVEDNDEENRAERHRQAQRALRLAMEKLPRSSRPSFVQLVDQDLPRNATRKVLRREVQAQLARMRETQMAVKEVTPAQAGQAGDPRVRHAVASVARKPVDTLSANQDLQNDLGFDSLMFTELVAALESAYPQLDPQALRNARTIAEIEAVTHPKAAPPSNARIEKDEEESNEDWRAPQWLQTPVRALLTTVQREGYNAFYKTKIRGRANIPQNRTCIVIANHASHLDLGLVKFALGDYGRDLVSLAAQDYFFKDRWRRLFFENFTNVAPLDRKNGLRKTLTQAESHLKAGRSILLFPEGTRSPDGQLQPFLPLLGSLCLNNEIDILPMYLKGTHEAHPKGVAYPKIYQPLEARIGPVLPAESLLTLTEGLKRSDAYRKATRLAQDAVEALRDNRLLNLEEHLKAHTMDKSDPSTNNSDPAAPKPETTSTRELQGSAVLMQEVQAAFSPGKCDKDYSFYITLGQSEADKWHLLVGPEACVVGQGKPPGGKADCVLKTSLTMFEKIVKERYTPSFSEFMSGKVKTNDPNLLKIFKKVFSL